VEILESQVSTEAQSSASLSKKKSSIQVKIGLLMISGGNSDEKPLLIFE
jgi:hypothetical protein